MNMLKGMQRFGKWLLVGLVLVNLFSLTFASNPSAIGSSLRVLCQSAKGFLGVGIFLMIILAAVTYAVGQIMGAETRARATVWATAMFTGAIFAGVIYMIVPWLVINITGLSGASGVAC